MKKVFISLGTIILSIIAMMIVLNIFDLVFDINCLKYSQEANQHIFSGNLTPKDKAITFIYFSITNALIQIVAYFIYKSQNAIVFIIQSIIIGALCYLSSLSSMICIHENIIYYNLISIVPVIILIIMIHKRNRRKSSNQINLN